MSATAAAALVLGAAAGSTRAAENLRIDPEHSSVTFSVRHLFTRVVGQFREFEGVVAFDESDLSRSSVRATIRATIIDTNVAERDKDLRSKRFFDVETYPTLEFVSHRVVPDGSNDRKFKIRGTLTMHGVVKEVVLDAEFLGRGKDPWGNLRHGFHATTRVNRKDFGMQWNEVLETGGFLVGDDVDITLDIEAVPAAS
jgi:polyisoprenoid-binding protein YceI